MLAKAKSRTYTEDLAEEMQDSDFARGLILEALKPNGCHKEAVRIGVAAMGTKAAAIKTGISQSHLSAVVSGRANLGDVCLNKALKAFGIPRPIPVQHKARSINNCILTTKKSTVYKARSRATTSAKK